MLQNREEFVCCCVYRLILSDAVNVMLDKDGAGDNSSDDTCNIHDYDNDDDKDFCAISIHINSISSCVLTQYLSSSQIKIKQF